MQSVHHLYHIVRYVSSLLRRDVCIRQEQFFYVLGDYLYFIFKRSIESVKKINNIDTLTPVLFLKIKKFITESSHIMNAEQT